MPLGMLNTEVVKDGRNMNETLEERRLALEQRGLDVSKAYATAAGVSRTLQPRDGRSGEIEQWRVRELERKAQSKYNIYKQDVDFYNQDVERVNVLDTEIANQLFQDVSEGKDAVHVVRISTSRFRRKGDWTSAFTGTSDAGGTYANEYSSGEMITTDWKGRVQNTPEQFKEAAIRSTRAKFGLNENDTIYYDGELVQSPNVAGDVLDSARKIQAERSTYLNEVAKYKAEQQTFLKQSMLESPTTKWVSPTAYSEAFKSQYRRVPEPDIVNNALIALTEKQFSEKKKMLLSPTAMWDRPEFYAQEVGKFERRGAGLGMDVSKMSWHGVEGQPGYQWSATDNQARLDAINRSDYPQVPGASSDIPQWLKEYRTGLEYPNTPIGAKYQEHAYKSASDYWGGLSTPQKAVALTYHGMRDFGVAGSFIQSRFVRGEKGYINKIYENAPKGQKSFKKGAGFVWEGMKGESSQMAVTGFGLGIGLKALKLSPTILKGLGYGATGYQGYSAVKDISEGDYGKAITESTVFVGSVPFIAAGYGTKLNIKPYSEKMFGSSLRASQIKAFGGKRYYIEPELKTAGKPFLEKAFGIKAKPSTPITNVKQKTFGYSGYEKPYTITALDVLLFDPKDPRWAKALKTGSLSTTEKIEYTRSERASQRLSEKAELERIRQEKMMFELSPQKSYVTIVRPQKIKTTSDTEFYARQKEFANTIREQNMFKELHRMAPEPQPQLELMEPPRRTKLVMERGELKSIPVWKMYDPIHIERARPDIYGENIHKSIVSNINKFTDFSQSRIVKEPKTVKISRPTKTIKPVDHIIIKAPPRQDISVKSMQKIKIGVKIGYVPSYKFGNVHALKPAVSQQFKQAQMSKYAQKQLQNQMLGTATAQRIQPLTETRTITPIRTRIQQKIFQNPPRQTIFKTPKTPKPPVIKIPKIRIPKSSKNTGIFGSKRGKKAYYGKFREIAKVASVRQIFVRKRIKI